MLVFCYTWSRLPFWAFCLLSTFYDNQAVPFPLNFLYFYDNQAVPLLLSLCEVEEHDEVLHVVKMHGWLDGRRAIG